MESRRGTLWPFTKRTLELQGKQHERVLHATMHVSISLNHAIAGLGLIEACAERIPDTMEYLS